ncbi:MAG TPA: NYN domain-containing protein [Patescibacteria group bacterium]
MKTALFIDGRNFIGKLKEVLRAENISEDEISHYDWSNYNFKDLIDKVLTGIIVDEKYVYFGKLRVHEDTKVKSKELIEEQRLLKTKLESQGFKVILAGSVRGNYVFDNRGKKTLVFKEKGADVSIAVDMVTKACDGTLKICILCSSDSDMQPAVKAVKERKVESIYLGFEVMPNKGLTATNHRTILIRNSEVIEFKINPPPTSLPKAF